MNWIEKVLAISDAPVDTSMIQKAYLNKDGNAAALNKIADKVIDLLLLAAGVIAVIYIIYSGILYITAAGNPDAVKKGTTGLIYGGIGVAVVIVAYYAIMAVTNFAVTNVGK